MILQCILVNEVLTVTLGFPECSALCVGIFKLISGSVAGKSLKGYSPSFWELLLDNPETDSPTFTGSLS